MSATDSKIGMRNRYGLVVAVITAVLLAVWFADVSLDFTQGQSDSSIAAKSVIGGTPITGAARNSDGVPLLSSSVGGVVRNAMGNPIPRARITLYQGTESISSLLADDQGRFAGKSPQGQVIVKAEAEGFGAASLYTVAPTMDLVLTLFPGNLVSGRVLRENSEQPVANVHVTATSGRDRASPLKDSAALTDEDGRFSLPDLPTGTWTLSVAEKNVWGESAEPIFVGSGDEKRDVILIVRAAASVSGQLVVQESGEPCPNGRLQLIPDGMMRASATTARATPIFSAASNSDGTIHFDAVPTGSYRVGPMCENHLIIDGPTSIQVSTTPITNQRWKFGRGLGLTVNVTDESGAPIENAAVALDLQETAGLSRGQVSIANRRAFTDSRGQYRFGALRASRYKISAQHPAVNGKQIAAAEIDLKAGSEPPAITLVLSGRGAIRIQAHSPAGTPTSRVLFFATDGEGARYEAKYAGNGRFSIGPLPRDLYRVFGYDNKNPKIPLNGGAPVSISGANTIDLDFEYEASSAAIEGHVIDGGGNAIGGVFVRAVSTTLDANDERYAGLQTALHGAQEQMTDTGGRFRIEGLRPDATFDLHLDHSSGMTVRRDDLRPGTFVEIAFPLASTVTGTVVDESGRIVDKFDVVVDSEGNAQSNSRSIADAGGRFRFSPVMPGKISVTIYGADGESSATRDLSVAPGQTADAGRFVLKADEPEKS